MISSTRRFCSFMLKPPRSVEVASRLHDPAPISYPRGAWLRQSAEPARIVIKRQGQQRFGDNEVIGLAIGASDVYCFDSKTGAALAA